MISHYINQDIRKQPMTQPCSPRYKYIALVLAQRDCVVKFRSSALQARGEVWGAARSRSLKNPGDAMENNRLIDEHRK